MPSSPLIKGMKRMHTEQLGDQRTYETRRKGRFEVSELAPPLASSKTSAPKTASLQTISSNESIQSAPSVMTSNHVGGGLPVEPNSSPLCLNATVVSAPLNFGPTQTRDVINTTTTDNSGINAHPVQSGRFFISDVAASLSSAEVSAESQLNLMTSSSTSLCAASSVSQRSQSPKRTVQSGRFRVVDIGQAASSRSEGGEHAQTMPACMMNMQNFDPLQMISMIQLRVKALVDENTELRKKNMALQKANERLQASSLSSSSSSLDIKELPSEIECSEQSPPDHLAS